MTDCKHKSNSNSRAKDGKTGKILPCLGRHCNPSSPSIPSAVAHLSKSMYCIARCRAVPRSAAVKPFYSRMNPGLSNENSRPFGSVGFANIAVSASFDISASIPRPFSPVTVSLEGNSGARLCG